MKKDKLKDFLYTCDFFSPKPEFYINGHTHLPNIFGAIISIITMLVILISSLFFFATFFTRTINSQIIDKAFSSNFSIPLTELPIIIQVQNSKFETIENSQEVINITPAIVTQTVITNPTTGKQDKSLIQKFLELERCDINKHLFKYKNLFSSIKDLETYYCIKEYPDKAELNGIYGEDNFTMLNFYMEHISSHIEEEEKEMDVNKIQADHALNYRIHIKFIEYFIDSTDDKAPIKTALQSDMLLFTDVIFKREWFYLSRVRFEIDKGFIFASSSNDIGFESSNYLETVDFDKIIGREGTQSVISFLLNSRETIYRVTYVKLPEILANIGGIANGIIYIAQMIIWIFSKRLYTVELINTLIKIDADSPKNRVYESKANILNNIKKYQNTLMTGKKSSSVIDNKVITLNCFQYFLPINWTWKTNQIYLFQKKLWMLKKNLDVKVILENNLRIFKKKIQQQTTNLLSNNNNNNMTILSHDNIFREND